MITFDRFEEGKTLGSVVIDVGDREISLWNALFPDDQAAEDVLPPGLVISLMMRGYIAILGERPQGNVHASQQLQWLRPAPKAEPLVVSLKCQRKDLKDGRCWVWLENGVTTKSGLECLRGTMRMLWAS